MPLELRRHVGRFLFDRGLQSLAYLGLLHPHARPQHHGLEVERNISYQPTGLPEHRLDLYRPQKRSGAPLPIVLYIHGGAFRILSKDTHWVMGLAFARRDYLVFNINYRLAPRHPFPSALEDACAALEFVISQAAHYGGDPSRLVIAGESAGANLATALSLLTVIRRPEPWAERVFRLNVVPRAVIPMCGMLQVTDSERFARRRPIPRWLNDRLVEVTNAYLRPDEAEEAKALADPLRILEQLAAGGRENELLRPLPPFFASVGTRDPLLDDTRRLEQALRRLGVPHEARYYPGELHAFQALVFREQARRCWRETYAFLDRHLAY